MAIKKYNFLKKVLQNLNEILKIFENFEKIVRNFWTNFEIVLEISLFAYSFQINFPNHYISAKNWWGARAPHAPPQTAYGSSTGSRRRPSSSRASTRTPCRTREAPNCGETIERADRCSPRRSSRAPLPGPPSRPPSTCETLAPSNGDLRARQRWSSARALERREREQRALTAPRVGARGVRAARVVYVQLERDVLRLAGRAGHRLARVVARVVELNASDLQ